MPLTIEFIGQQGIALRLNTITDEARRALLDAVTESALDLQARVREKLSGEVLRPRTHRLYDSIAVDIRDDGTAVSATIGTDVVYAAFQEYGFTGTEQIREHLRRVSVAFGRRITPVTAMVRAHARRVSYPPHSFLRSSLAEKEPAIRARIAAAVGGAVNP